MPWPMIRSAMMSAAKTAIFPMRDIVNVTQNNTGHVSPSTTIIYEAPPEEEIGDV